MAAAAWYAFQCAFASIVPPPFGSGYDDTLPARYHRHARLQLCRPLSGAVMASMPPRQLPARRGLQLCRPLSGAVIILGKVECRMQAHASIVPPPFGSGYRSVCI